MHDCYTKRVRSLIVHKMWADFPIKPEVDNRLIILTLLFGTVEPESMQ